MSQPAKPESCNGDRISGCPRTGKRALTSANGCKLLPVQPLTDLLYKVEKMTGLFFSLCYFLRSLCGVGARKENQLHPAWGKEKGQLHMPEEMSTRQSSDTSLG